MSPPAAAAAPGGTHAKHYILAVLAVTLIAAAVVTIIFVVLSPARIVFSVVDARHRDQQLGADGDVQLFFNITASNPSRRASVRYRSMYVDVNNSTGPQWTHWVSANLTTTTTPAAMAMPLDQPTENSTTINATVTLVGSNGFARDFTRDKTNHGFRVKITTVVRFKVGVSWTRLYDIKVVCGPLDFFANQSSTAGCQDA